MIDSIDTHEFRFVSSIHLILNADSVSGISGISSFLPLLLPL